MTVKDILNRKGSTVYSVHPNETVYDAIKKMADLNIGALLVLDDGKVKGIISERDYKKNHPKRKNLYLNTGKRHYGEAGILCKQFRQHQHMHASND